jgi:hypothetical protein
MISILNLPLPSPPPAGGSGLKRIASGRAAVANRFHAMRRSKLLPSICFSGTVFVERLRDDWRETGLVRLEFEPVPL